MPTSSAHSSGVDCAALARVVEPIAHAHGAEVVDVELRPERGGWVLRVLVEKAGASANNLSTRDAAVDLALCTDVSRDLSAALDVVDLIQHAYHLEVSSPGVERPLKQERDYVRFTGQKAKLKLREPSEGRRVVVGLIEGAAEGRARVAVDGKTVEIPLAQVEQARLVFELTGQPKGGAGQKQRKQ